MSRGRDAEYTEYVAARLSSLRRLAGVLCDDWQRADDLVHATDVATLFKDHMRLLGTSPANWTTRPIG
jgi:DNA-directed RNA polymerase specialized sigma24 family protein